MPFSHMAVNISELKKIESVISFTSFIEAPLFANSVIGKLNFVIDGKTYFSLNIVNSNDIFKKDIWFYFNFLFSNFFEFIH